MTNEEGQGARRSSGRLLAWVAVGFGVALLTAVVWLLARPAATAAAADPVRETTPNVQRLVGTLTGGQQNPLPAAGDSGPLNCLSCHNQPLSSHDKLGEGNQACYACHVSTDWSMDKLELANGAVISKADSSQLCGQCHQERFAAWEEGTHGIPGTVAAIPCTGCHNPHQPEIVFQGITRPPMPPFHTPPPLPKDLVIILGICVGCLLAGAALYARRRTNE